MKMVLIQHLFGIPSLRQTHQRIHDTLSYRWFLGYGLLDEIPHFATVSYDPSAIFIDGTHVKASANKKKFQKEQVKKAAKIYSGQRRREVNAEREKLGKKSIEDEEDDDNNDTPQGGKWRNRQKTVPTTDPDCGMFVKEEHERQFAYAAMNLKKLANWSWNNSFSFHYFSIIRFIYAETPAFAS